VIIHDHKEA